LVGRREVAEELLQETFLQAWGEASRYRAERATPRGWLLMMGRSRAIDRLRSSGARARREETVGRELVGSGAIEAVGTAHLEAEARGRQVRSALDQLPPEQRQCIELAFYEGLSHRQVAERLGQPLGTVKSRILLGMGKLRQALSP
jgi:RNA polymerase sigma-70 factor (ECF subfamily)